MNKLSIKQTLSDQQSELKEFLSTPFIPRQPAPLALQAAENASLAKVVLGVRRCGKSVFAHQLFQGHPYGYVNFDDERLYGLQTGQLGQVLEDLQELHPGVNRLIFDEIQNVEGWELFVNRLLRRGFNIVVTGSNSKMLSRELATHLTGRQITIELYPFSFREFLLRSKSALTEAIPHIESWDSGHRADAKRLLSDYLRQGGFPELFNISFHGEYLRELFDKIVMRDIVARYRLKYSPHIKELGLYLIDTFSSRTSYSKLRNLFKIPSVSTVKNYVQYLNDAYLTFEVQAFSFKLKERLGYSRKNYCIDPGLASAISPSPSPNDGRILENAVYLELRRRRKEVFFCFDRDSEIDFLTREGRKVTSLIQVCHSLRREATWTREIEALGWGAKKFHCDNLLIITWDEEGEEKVDGHTVRVVPAWKWLLSE